VRVALPMAALRQSPSPMKPWRSTDPRRGLEAVDKIARSQRTASRPGWALLEGLAGSGRIRRAGSIASKRAGPL
jgi:hypothetical protein